MSTLAAVDRLMEGEFTVQAADIIRLVLGFLHTQGLKETANCLRQESGIGYVGGVMGRHNVAASVRQGDWGSVLDAMRLLQEDDEASKAPDALQEVQVDFVNIVLNF